MFSVTNTTRIGDLYRESTTDENRKIALLFGVIVSFMESVDYTDVSFSYLRLRIWNTLNEWFPIDIDELTVPMNIYKTILEHKLKFDHSNADLGFIGMFGLSKKIAPNTVNIITDNHDVVVDGYRISNTLLLEINKRF